MTNAIIFVLFHVNDIFFFFCIITTKLLRYDYIMYRYRYRYRLYIYYGFFFETQYFKFYLKKKKIVPNKTNVLIKIESFVRYDFSNFAKILIK